MYTGNIRRRRRSLYPYHMRGSHRRGGALHRRRLRAGEKAIALIDAANRDPARFEDSDALDIGRGIHYCLGASLAVL